MTINKLDATVFRVIQLSTPTLDGAVGAGAGSSGGLGSGWRIYDRWSEGDRKCMAMVSGGNRGMRNSMKIKENQVFPEGSGAALSDSGR